MTAPTIAPAKITTPGVYRMDAETYHADPVDGGSLSSSGARLLLPPSCPAKFRWEQDHGEPPKAVFEFGTAAHRLVLGDGPELVVIDHDSWRTKAAKEAADEARAEGKVPLLADDYLVVEAMADAIRRHPVAGPLFTPGTGVAEAALVWRDEPTGVMCRALVDWLPDKVPGRRRILVDYKTARSGDPDTLGRAAHGYGYHQQDAWYSAGAKALGLADDDMAFLFVSQEKTPPYLVTLSEFDHEARLLGERLNRHALNVYCDCVETGRWPGYGDDQVARLYLPPWAFAQEGTS